MYGLSVLWQVSLAYAYLDGPCHGHMRVLSGQRG